MLTALDVSRFPIPTLPARSLDLGAGDEINGQGQRASRDLLRNRSFVCHLRFGSVLSEPGAR